MGVLAIALTVLGFVTGAVAFGRPRRLADGDPVDLSAVSLIIPARNEEHSLPHLLRSLTPDAASLHSVTVVDDSSSDDTAAVASAHSYVDVVPAAAPPPGWVGKSWSCDTGAERTSGDVLLFVDADVTFGPNGLRDIISAHRASGAVISVQPHHRVESFAEHASWLPNVVSFMAIGAGSDHPTALYGPVLCCSRDQYDRFGGHQAVRGAIAEDVEIGRVLLANETPFEVYAGGTAATFRMYPSGLRQLIEGWSKNLATGSASVRPTRAAAASLWVYALLQASLLVPEMATTGNPIGALALVAAGAVSLAVTGRALGTFRLRYSLLFPLWAVSFTGLMAASAWKTLVARKVQWRGRDVSLRGRPDPRVELP